MDKVIVYSQHLSLDSIENTEIVNIRTKEKLAKALVSEENIRCLVIDIPEISEDHISFFACFNCCRKFNSPCGYL